MTMEYKARSQSRYARATAVLLLVIHATPTSAFQSYRPSSIISHTRFRSVTDPSIRASPLDEIPFNDDDDEYAEGLDLARQFAEAVRLREEEGTPAYLESEGPRSELSEEEKRARNSDPFSSRREIRAGKDVMGIPSEEFVSPPGGMESLFSEPTKFTGMDASRQGVARQGGTRQGGDRSNAQFGDEMDAVSRAENTIYIQAAITLVLLIATIAVGLMGGITDGSDRNYGGDDDFDSDPTVLFDDGSGRQPAAKTSERGNGDWNKDASVWI